MSEQACIFQACMNLSKVGPDSIHHAESFPGCSCYVIAGGPCALSSYLTNCLLCACTATTATGARH